MMTAILAKKEHLPWLIAIAAVLFIAGGVVLML
jgi:hypothetical protein